MNDPKKCQCKVCLDSPEGQCRFPQPDSYMTRCAECRRLCQAPLTSKRNRSMVPS